jgi:cytochrome c oxidase subunit II
MTVNYRSRQVTTALAAVALTLVLAACAGGGVDKYPNTTFEPITEFGRIIDALWDRLLLLGTVVFILVEAILVYTIIRFRARPNQPRPEHVHGNTTLEILWTAIPAVILIFIAVPTVRAIFKTQAKPVGNALQVEVIGHQWWWEFRYPQYTLRSPTGKLDTLVTANEMYIPTGRTVNLSLRTADVIHSFWAPRLGGKRDLIANHTNYLWYTPDTGAVGVWNGSCNEYCGASHANMRWRAFTVSPADFELWVAHQLTPGAVTAPAPVPPPAAPTQTAGTAPRGTPAVTPAPAPAATTPTGAPVVAASTSSHARRCRIMRCRRRRFRPGSHSRTDSPAMRSAAARSIRGARASGVTRCRGIRCRWVSPARASRTSGAG